MPYERMRLRLPPAVNNELEVEEAEAWDQMLWALGISEANRALTTHDKDCHCGKLECGRLLAVRRYVKAHINARRIRFAHKALQERLDDFIKDENARSLELDHAEALKMLETDIPF